MKKVAVIILNWNGKQFLEQFLPSVLASTYPNLVIYIADNASTDNSIDYIQSLIDQAKNEQTPYSPIQLHHLTQLFIVKNEQNYGFAQGYNTALQSIDADYFVLLNSDVEVAANWVEPIINILDNDSSIAACQPKILNYNDKNVFEHAGASGGFIDFLGYPFCRGRILNICEPDTGQYNNLTEVAWASGTALFIRPDVFKLLGGFDSSFFAHMEEIDLCWRIRRLGLKIMACPQAVVWHVGGGTLQSNNPFKTYLNFRNNWAMLFKNLNTLDLCIVLPCRVCLDVFALIVFMLKREFGNAKALLKAHLHIWLRIIAILQTRKKTNKLIANNQQGKDRSTQTGFYKGSIIFDFFVRGKKTFKQLINADNLEG